MKSEDLTTGVCFIKENVKLEFQYVRGILKGVLNPRYPLSCNKNSINIELEITSLTDSFWTVRLLSLTGTEPKKKYHRQGWSTLLLDCAISLVREYILPKSTSIKTKFLCSLAAYSNKLTSKERLEAGGNRTRFFNQFGVNMKFAAVESLEICKDYSELHNSEYTRLSVPINQFKIQTKPHVNFRTMEQLKLIQLPEALPLDVTAQERLERKSMKVTFTWLLTVTLPFVILGIYLFSLTQDNLPYSLCLAVFGFFCALIVERANNHSRIELGNYKRTSKKQLSELKDWVETTEKSYPHFAYELNKLNVSHVRSMASIAHFSLKEDVDSLRDMPFEYLTLVKDSRERLL